MLRGAFQFEVSDGGDLLDSARNVETLRRLFLDHTLVTGENLGPGDRGDFDVGAWHVSCHLAGAGGVRRHKNGGLLWLEISHDRARDSYFASVTLRDAGSLRTVPLATAEGRSIVSDSRLLGFVEGTSLGAISAEGVQDPPDLFNWWRRQDFDQPVDATIEGGKVWEHWCTLRDIRPSHRIGTATLAAYVTLVSALGDRFAATVARGRREYGHPVQLAAFAWAGFVGHASATWDTKPVALPKAVEALFLQAKPGAALAAVERLEWPSLRYYMFSRKLKGWSTAAHVRKDIKAFKPE